MTDAQDGTVEPRVPAADERRGAPDRVEAAHGAHAAGAPVADPPSAPAEPIAPAEPVAPTPAAEDAPPPKHGNRVVATFWVLFAALIFQVLYVLLIALLVALVAGPAEVGAQMGEFFREPFITWVPVVVFAVLYEIAVLVLGRAGRFVYVVASLVVGVLVWLGSTGAIDLLETGGRLTGARYVQTLIAPNSVIVGVLAREVMLWTGYAVGARGLRLRRRNRRERAEYRARRDTAAG